MAVLSLKSVGYTYEKTTKPVFRGLNADFGPGKVYCIVGKSGAGKTSLLSLLAGLDTCTEGTILYEGEDLCKLDRDDYRAKKIGVVFQGYNLLLNKSALENIELSMAISGVRHKNNRAYALALLESVGIDGETAGRRVLGICWEVIRMTYPAGNSSGSASHVPCPTSQTCCWQMNQAEIWTGRQKRM